MKGLIWLTAILIHKKDVPQIRPAPQKYNQFFDDMIEKSFATCL
jgi:hypothetical protein